MKIFVVSMVAILVLSLGFPLSYSQSSYNSLESDIADRINQYRISNGLNPLSYDSGIANVARTHSQDMADRNYFTHETKDTNRTAVQRGLDAGYSYCGDPASLQKYHDTVFLLTEYNNRISKYNQEVQAFNQFYSDNVALHNKLVLEERWLDQTSLKLDIDIAAVNKDIEQVKIGAGLAENIARMNNYDLSDQEQFTNGVLDTWKNSPEHNRGMLGWFHSMGVGIVEKGNTAYVTLNMC